MDAQARTRARIGSTVLVVVALVVALSGSVLLVGSATPAGAACAPRLVVSKTAGLSAGGEIVTVSGSCYDVNKGVYVAFCVVPPAGSVPSPCGGGVDMSGAGGLSHWISSNPPPQGEGLTVPYGPGGSFTVTMRPAAALNATVDCRRVSCAVVTRNDHTRSGDRSQDVIVPVTFAVDPAPTTTAPAPVVAPPPIEAPTTTASEETTTTTAAEEAAVTTSTVAGGPTGATGDDGADELAAEPVSASSGSSGPSGALVGAIALVVLAAAGVGGWFALRRRTAVATVVPAELDGPGAADAPGDPS